MIVLEQVLFLFYNLVELKNKKRIDNGIYFIKKNTKYLFLEFKDVNVPFLLFTQNFLKFHKIILNKYKEPISIFYGRQYLLMKINENLINRYINLEDVIELSNIKVFLNSSKINYLQVWENKINFFENYFKKSKCAFYMDHDYFLGLAEISFTIAKEINFNNITYGFSMNRFYKIETIFDLYNPVNNFYGPIVNSISEYIKYAYFTLNKKEDFNKIFTLKFTKDDILFLIARLIFPTYYFDIYKIEDNYDDYNTIVNKIEGYITYIKEIFEEIKKRYNLPFLNIIINLL